MRDVAAGAEPTAAATELLKALISASPGANASLYFLDLVVGQYRLFSHGGPNAPRELLRLPDVGVSESDLSADGEHLRQLQSNSRVHRLPVVRNETVIGVLDLESDDIASELISEPATVNVLSAVFIWIYEQHFAARLMGALQRPIPFDQSEEWFLSEILNVIRGSSGMAYAAVRERAADGALRCLAVRGFGEESQEALRSDLTFEEVDEAYPAFAEAMAMERPVAELDMDSPRNKFLQTHPTLESVGSYVVAPIMVGNEVFGTLSLATKVRYPFTPFELSGFMSIANGVGIAIANFRNYHDMTERFGDIAVGVTALEISTAVRHATGDILDRCGHFLGEVEEGVPRPSPMAKAAMGELSTELQLLENELQKFKVATERPQRELETVDLEKKWRYAVDALKGRMDNLGVVDRYDGPRLEILGYGDWIGHLFLNLILNSLDAFEDGGKKRGREVRLRVQRPVPKEDIEVIYSDNGPGLGGKTLLGGAQHVSELPLNQRIFEPNVTSKRDREAGYRAQPGAGLGLFLVRKIMADHQGSIDLLDSKEGARFRLRFPQLVD